MKIAILQSSFAGFFPRYYKALYNASISNGDEACVFGNRNSINKRTKLPNQILFGSRLNWHIHHTLYKLFGLSEIYSFTDTLDLTLKLSKFKPDVIHLNVINGCILNMPMLVRYANRNKIPIVWTMHDCRAFTASCPYPDEADCDKWQNGCEGCPVCNTNIDNSRLQWKIKRRWNSGFSNLTIVTPSEWLANFIRKSFLKEHPLKVIYNGVDTIAFSQKSTFDVHKEYNIPKEKKIILGCAINWESRKGLNFFESMAETLSTDYQIVLVGGITENKRKEFSKKGIICTGRTSTLAEMIAWYQSATVFCNPTLADNFPTTNIEALAAGTPVVTFRTGGSPEAIDKNTGIAVEQGNKKALCDAVRKICEHKELYKAEFCRKRAQHFSLCQYNEYVKLYHSLV